MVNLPVLEIKLKARLCLLKTERQLLPDAKAKWFRFTCRGSKLHASPPLF